MRDQNDTRANSLGAEDAHWLLRMICGEYVLSPQYFVEHIDAFTVRHDPSQLYTLRLLSVVILA
jgi:hypothetical protein